MDTKAMDTKANPYAPHLGEQDPIKVLGRTAARLAEICEKLGPDGVEKAPAPGKWSARETVCHLADCELVFGYRLRQTLAEDFHVIQPFDQDDWARTYSAYDLRGALEVFSSLRRWNLSLIRSAGPAELSKRLRHPERDEMTFQTVVETMAGHDINHLKQLDALAFR
jgi:DinB family protein